MLTRAFGTRDGGGLVYVLSGGQEAEYRTVEPWIASNLVCECFTRRAKILKEF